MLVFSCLGTGLHFPTPYSCLWESHCLRPWITYTMVIMAMMQPSVCGVSGCLLSHRRPGLCVYTEVYTHTKVVTYRCGLVPRCVFRSWQCLNARAHKKENKEELLFLLLRNSHPVQSQHTGQQTGCKGLTFTGHQPRSEPQILHCTQFLQCQDCPEVFHIKEDTGSLTDWIPHPTVPNLLPPSFYH